MTPEDHARAAADLLQAEQTGDQIGLLTLRHPEMGMDDAYAVQNAIYRAKLQAGRKVIGWKIGLTSKAMQYALTSTSPTAASCLTICCLQIAQRFPRAGLSSPGSKPK